MMLGKRFEEY